VTSDTVKTKWGIGRNARGDVVQGKEGTGREDKTGTRVKLLKKPKKSTNTPETRSSKKVTIGRKLHKKNKRPGQKKSHGLGSSRGKNRR